MSAATGERVRLVSTDDPYTDLRPGALGTVYRVRNDPWGEVIYVRWDDGSTLSLLDGIDRWEVVS